jgi:biofilm PGA synthesis N-glycosyltransferase PgaC
VTWAFWLSAALIVYTYAGYLCFLWFRARIAPRPIKKESIEPSVSIVIAVFNEAARIPAKLQMIAELDYPKDKLEIVIASDGSTDGTNELLRSLPQVKAVICPENRGKAAALNAAMAQASGEIVLFTDARQKIEPKAVRELVANFADPEVGCVSGELMFVGQGGQESGVSLYWRLEKVIRKLESATGSVVGATGAIYAVRRSLVPTLPDGTLLDDVYIPVHVVRQSHRVVFEPAARAWDEEPEAGKQEFRRKVRTLAGNYQLLQLAPWLLSWQNPQWGRFVSHKVMRLWVPFLLVINFVTAWTLYRQPVFLVIAAVQTLFYVLASIGMMTGERSSRLVSTPAAFCVLNAAAAVALFSFMRHRGAPTRMWKNNKVTQDITQSSALLNATLKNSAIASVGFPEKVDRG